MVTEYHISDFGAVDEWSRLMSWRWPDGKPKCPYCGHEKLYYIETRRRFKCAEPGCRKQFSITSGTALHSPKCGAAKIIKAIETLGADPNASAREIMRQTSMSQRGAYYLARRLREALA